MVDYQHDDNTYGKLNRRRRFYLITSVALVTLLVIGAYIAWDGLSAQTVVTENTPTEATLGETVRQKVFDKPTYQLTTDVTWVEIEDRDDRYQIHRYHSLVDGLVKRELAVYVNTRPPELPVTHVMPVELDGPRITPLEVSPKCDELQPIKSNRRDVTLSWAGAEFLCDPDLKAYVVGTSHNEMGYDIEVKGQLSDATYTFVYRDFEAIPRPAQFEELLSDFKAK